MYSIVMALVGIIGFALLLALTEQILLEVLEANVQEGTTVFESGHILVLSHCIAGKDMETLWRVLGQARSSRLHAVLPFSKLINLFFGYFDPQSIF